MARVLARWVETSVACACAGKRLKRLPITTMSRISAASGSQQLAVIGTNMIGTLCPAIMLDEGLIGTLCPALMIEMKAVVGVAVGDEQLLAGRHVACGFQKHAFRHPRRFLYQMYRCRYLLHLYV